MKDYLKFAAMIISATVIMYGLMYLNTYEMSHLYWSETRLYMALYMGSAMAVIMLLFMSDMYKNRLLNAGIIVGSIVLFCASVFLVRNQETVQDVAWMKAMIPHHSIAILTSKRAEISDPRVRALADDIIDTQVKEIKEMEALITDIKNKNPPCERVFVF